MINIPISRIERLIKFRIENEETPINISTDIGPNYNNKVKTIRIDNDEKTIVSVSNTEIGEVCTLHKTPIKDHIDGSWNVDSISELDILIGYSKIQTNCINIVKQNRVYNIELYDEPSCIKRTGVLFGSNKESRYQVYIETEHQIIILKISEFDENSIKCIFKKEHFNKKELKAFNNIDGKLLLYSGTNYFTSTDLYIIVSRKEYVKFTVKQFTDQDGFVFNNVNCLFKNIFFVILKRGESYQLCLLLNDKVYSIETNDDGVRPVKETWHFNKKQGIIFYYSYKEEKLKLIKLTRHKIKSELDIFKPSINHKYKTPIVLKSYFLNPTVLDLDSEEENSFVTPLTEDYEEQMLIASIVVNDKFYFLTNRENLYKCQYINKNNKGKKEKSKQQLGITEDLSYYFKRFEIRENKFKETNTDNEHIKTNLKNIEFIRNNIGNYPIERMLEKQNILLDSFLERLNINSNIHKKGNVLTTNIIKIYQLLLYKLNFFHLKLELESYCKYYNKLIIINKTIEANSILSKTAEINNTKLNTVDKISKECSIVDTIKSDLYDVLKSNKKEYDKIITLREQNNMNRSYKNIFGDYLPKKKPDITYQPIVNQTKNVNSNKKDNVAILSESEPKPQSGLLVSIKPIEEPINTGITANRFAFGSGSELSTTFVNQSNQNLNKGKHSDFVFGSNNEQPITNNIDNPNNFSISTNTNFFNMPSNTEQNINSGWLGTQFNPNNNDNTGLNFNANTDNFMDGFNNSNLNNNENNNTGSQFNFDVSEFRK